TVNGTDYDGRVKLVSAGDPSNCYIVYYNIPSSVTYNNKTFAVTCIGEQTFNNHDTSITHTNITVVGCHNIDTIGNYAFYNQPLSIFPFTKTLKSIGHYAFSGTNLKETVAIPYGVKYIGSYAFSNGKYNRIVVPQGVSSFCDMWCNTSTLTEIVYNNSYHYTYSGWNMTGVPSACYIRVPVGVVNHYRQNSALSSRANYITAGATTLLKTMTTQVIISSRYLTPRQLPTTAQPMPAKLSMSTIPTSKVRRWAMISQTMRWTVQRHIAHPNISSPKLATLALPELNSPTVIPFR
ncbi:MAG: leucine-rich repeat domain-containing protein, partial [Muribaculaceae bacterium]|nr:leucine-rich repeat domain-containing protein [Muribaculaceae bacterium]